MRPAVSLTFGGRIFHINGAKLIALNNTLETDTGASAPAGGYKPHGTTTHDMWTWHWGGDNSYWPEAYANHKPGAWYHGWLYQHGHVCDYVGGWLYIHKFDGSGIYKQQGATFYNTAWTNGRGTKLLSPSGSGGNAEIRAHELAWVEHHGVLFAVGCVPTLAVSLSSSSWIKKCGWYIQNGAPADSVANMRSRGYAAFYMHYKPSTGKTYKGISLIKKFKPFSPYFQWLHACDAISFKDDIYYANWVDILRFPGGSGTPQLIESASGIYPTAKCFCQFPASGYIAGVPQGDNTLFMLTGSGALKTIGTSDHKVRTIYDLKYISSDVRPYSNVARVQSETNEPGRSSLLLNFNNKLEAFIVSATSGYRHFQCNGNPASGSAWTDKTILLPDALKRFDGNVFGFVDNVRNKIYVAHMTMSEVGLCGHLGAQKSAGSITVYERGPVGLWTTVHESMPGEVSRGLIPYNNTGPQAIMPSGSSATVYSASDYAIIQYTLYDHYKRPVDVDIEYSNDDGMTWHAARRFKSYTPGAGYLGSGVTNLPTTPRGLNYTFYWDYVNDLGFNVPGEGKVRITPRLTR